ncbi:MAG: hypothetical protein ACJ8EN_16125, partial [Xanthobacteraceae bacterium]
EQAIWHSLHKRGNESTLDPFMSDALRRHHDDFPLDQLEPLVLADHPRIDHAADVLDREGATGKTFGGAGDCDIHNVNQISPVTYNTPA